MSSSVRLPMLQSGGGGGGGINYTVEVFTSSGTYTKPSNLDYAYVLMVSGGGGGGSGRIGAAGSNRGGGAGSNGLMIITRFNNDELSVSESVTVGAGGNGAVPITTNNTNGTSGAFGGNTIFKYGSNFFIAGGNSSGGSTFIPSTSTPNRTLNIAANMKTLVLNAGFTTILGDITSSDAFRGNAVTTQARNLSPFANGSFGGGIRSTNEQVVSGPLSGFYDDNNNLIDELPGTNPETAPVQPTQFYTFGQFFKKILHWFNPAHANYNVGRCGIGGGCGDTAGTVAGFAGADAVGYGAGGGGGGASTNGANSGAGGNGAGGIVIIVNVLNS